MTCPACATARSHRLSGAYVLGCRDCEARKLSRTPAYADAARANAITPRYRDALIATFGEEWRQGHDMVKGWASRE